VSLERTSSIADGLMSIRIGTIPFAHHRAFIDDVVTVPDDDIVAAMKFLLEREKLVTEPSGAITVAALLSGRVQPRGETAVVLSGGNVDWPGLVQLLQ
jgi:threonine dehydratase